VSVEPTTDTGSFVIISIGAGGLLAICGVLLAWFKWRHKPDDK